MKELPSSWDSLKTSELFSARKGKKPRILKAEESDGFVPYLDIHAVEKGNYRQYADIASSRIGIKEDIFIVWDGARSGWVALGKEGAIGSTLVALQTLIGAQEYLFYFLKSQFEYINSNTRGTGIPHVDPSIFDDIEVPLPPLNEQKRIVEKLEKLLGKVEAAQERLDKIPNILKRFRQSVLAAACSGKLTADWRVRNPEDAKDLLQNISAALGRDIEIVDSSKFGVYTPKEWVWVNLGEVIEELRNGIPVKPEIQPPGTPMLRISSTRSGNVDLTDIRYLPNSERYLQNFTLQDRDLLFTRYNGSLDLLGVCGMVRHLKNAVLFYPDKLMRLRLGHNQILPEYTEMFFQSPEARERMTDKAKSSAGQNGISGKDVKLQPIALPPLDEQKEIVRRVEELFKFADQIEERYKKARGHTDKLTQSILAKAFRGELVPQDPNDEPASVLLERVRDEHSSASTPGAKRKIVNQ